MDKDISTSVQNIQQSVDTEQWHEVEHFILADHSTLFSLGLHKQVGHWINSLPEEHRQSQQINLQLAYSLIPYQETRAFNLFASIFDQAIDEGDTELVFTAWTGLAECCFYNLNRYNTLKQWIVKANQLLKTELLPTAEKPRNAFIAAYCSAILLCTPDKKSLKEWRNLAQNALDNSTNTETRTLLSNHLILASIWQGDMYQASSLANEFLGHGSLLDQNPLMYMIQKTVQAQVAWLNVNKEASLLHVKEGLKYSSISEIHIFDTQLSAQAVYACMVDNDFKGAEKHLKSIEKIKNPHHILDNSQYHYLTGWVAVSTGDIETALTHAKRAVELTKVAGVAFTEAIARILLAQVHFEKNNFVRALHHLAKAQRIGKRMGSLHIRYAGLLAQSWAMFQFKRDGLALRYLRLAFEIGAQQGYVHIPGWPYKIMDRLCEIALHNGIQPEYAKKLIRLHHIYPSDAPNAPTDWPWAVKIMTLGGFRLYTQGELVTFKRKTQKKPLELLKVLIALGGKNIAIDRLMDKLWPENEGDAAQSVFDSTLQRLRTLLKDKEALVLSNGQLSIDPLRCWVDIQALDQVITEASDVTDRDELEKTIDKILELYEGAFLTEEQTSWVIHRRQQIQIKVVRGLEALCNKMPNHRHCENLDQIFENILEIEPYSEMFYQHLMCLYIEQGRMADAVRVYLRCVKALSAGLGVLPSRQTQKLYLQILATSIEVQINN